MSDVRGSVTLQDLSNAITKPIKKTENDNALIEAVRFNNKGQNDLESKKKFSENETCAVRVKAGRNFIYKIKTGRGGRFYNPLKDSTNYGLSVRSKANNDSMFQLREVGQTSFNSYVKFLQTRYDSYLIAAEREA